MPDDEDLLTGKEEEDDTQIAMQEPISAYPAPLFAALPFLSMGLPFPPLYIYPQLTPFLYYHHPFPVVQIPATTLVAQEEDCRRPPKPKPACDFCMENEGSLTCLYYQQRDVDGDPVTTDLLPASEPAPDPSEIQDSSDQKSPPSLLLVTDENAPAAPSAKNPGWFGKGYRKGMKRKR